MYILPKYWSFLLSEQSDMLTHHKCRCSYCFLHTNKDLYREELLHLFQAPHSPILPLGRVSHGSLSSSQFRFYLQPFRKSSAVTPRLPELPNKKHLLVKATSPTGSLHISPCFQCDRSHGWDTKMTDPFWLGSDRAACQSRCTEQWHCPQHSSWAQVGSLIQPDSCVTIDASKVSTDSKIGTTVVWSSQFCSSSIQELSSKGTIPLQKCGFLV